VRRLSCEKVVGNGPGSLVRGDVAREKGSIPLKALVRTSRRVREVMLDISNNEPELSVSILSCPSLSCCGN